jgi:hypothetical protein
LKDRFQKSYYLPLLSFFLPASILGQDYRLYPTGLLLPTEEEQNLMDKYRHSMPLPPSFQLPQGGSFG